MRCSLFVPIDSLPDRLRVQAYHAAEQQVIAAELAGFSAVWLADQWLRTPPQLPDALAMLQRLSMVTDRVDLGVILRLPPGPLRPRLQHELLRLDDLSGGRLRVALDLRGGSAEERAAGLTLLETLAERLGARQAPGLARRVALIADDAAAPVAGANGLGMLLTPGDPLHARRLWLARYHDARELRSGWVARLLSLAVGADADDLQAIRRGLPEEAPLLSPAAEPTLFGLPNDLIAQLAVIQIADGLDEVLCAIAPGIARPETRTPMIALIGQRVLPHLQPAAPPQRLRERRRQV